MIVSVNWLKKFVDIDLSIDKLAELIGARLVEIEQVIDLGAKYKDVYVAKVIEASKLEGSDHLNVTKIDDGGKSKDVTRDENGYIQVVCGASNVTAGINIAWLPPNSIVPNTFNTDDPFKLGVRELRGVTSNGMIASARELDLYDEHDGILILDDNLSPGDSFASVYELNDYLLDIENKSLTHRPDTFGIVGFAREVAAISGKAFKTDDWLKNVNPEFMDADSGIKMPAIAIDNPNLSSRFQMVALSGVDGTKTSPMIFQTYLARVGMRPINAVVDATNYMMMLSGQPMGIYDYDKVMALCNDDTVHVRGGRAGEKLALLDGRDIELSSEDIVVSAGDTAIGLAGAMGGANTVVDSTTKNIMIESASFNLYSLRSTQMRHGIFSEAITRFTKGQPPELTAPVLSQVVKLVGDWTGVGQVSEVVEDYPAPTEPLPIDVTVDSINSVLGSKLQSGDVLQTLQNAEFQVDGDDNLKVTAPYWRADIHIPEDIVEEVGRLNGYDNIEPTLPSRDFKAVSPSSADKLHWLIRDILVRAGANEVFTYSFVHGDILKKSGQSPDDSYRITNSLSPDLQYYRQSLTPSLLQLIHPNIKSGYDSFAVFETNKVHPKGQGLTDENVPKEISATAMTIVSKGVRPGAPYYMAKNFVEFLGSRLGLNLVFNPIVDDLVQSSYGAPFEHRHSALVTDVNTGAKIGIVGEYKASVRRAFKLPEYSAGFEFDSDALLTAHMARPNKYRPSSRFPSTERDICFKVNEDVNYRNVFDAVMQAADNQSDLEINVSPIDIYQASGDNTKNITIRINVSSYSKTLTGQDAADIADKIIASVVVATDATVV